MLFAGAGKLTEAYQEHLAETRDHAEPSRRDCALSAATPRRSRTPRCARAAQLDAFFAAHPDTPGKLAAFSYAFEHLEIGGYEQLKRVAVRAGDDATAALVERILEQELVAAETIRGLLPEAALRALATA